MAARSGHEAWAKEAAELLVALHRDEPLPVASLRALLAVLGQQPPVGVWHPTGFVVLALYRDERGALRLHLWPESAREHGRPCWPVHDHVWHLRSHVLDGVVCSHGYRVDDDPSGDSRLYGVDYAGGRRSRMRKSDRRVRVHPQPPQRVEAGHRYDVPAGEFHASRVEPGEAAATLVATTNTGRSRPWVVGPDDGPEAVPVERSVAEAERVRCMLDRVGARLGRGCAPVG